MAKLDFHGLVDARNVKFKYDAFCMQVFVTTGVPRNEGLKLVESYVTTLHTECYILSDITYK